MGGCSIVTESQQHSTGQSQLRRPQKSVYSPRCVSLTQIQVHSYPTVLTFRSHEGREHHHKYEGKRQAQEVVEYARRQELPYTELSDIADLAPLQQSVSDKAHLQNDILVLCVQCSTPIFHAFTEAAAQQIHASFVVVKDAAVVGQVRAATTTTAEVVLLRNFDEPEQGFSDAPEKLDLWLQQRSVPLIAHFSPAVAEVIVKPGNPIVWSRPLDFQGFGATRRMRRTCKSSSCSGLWHESILDA